MRVVGPTSRCPSSQLYSIMAPTLKFSTLIVELGGCSGRPQALGSVNIETDHQYEIFIKYFNIAINSCQK